MAQSLILSLLGFLVVNPERASTAWQAFPNIIGRVYLHSRSTLSLITLLVPGPGGAAAITQVKR